MDQTKLIYKVLSGDASQEEKQSLEEWKSLSAENLMEFEDIKLLWDFDADNEEEDLEINKGSIDLMEGIRKWEQRRRKIKRMIYTSVAVVILVLIYWLSYHRGTRDRPSVYLGYNSSVVQQHPFRDPVT